MPVLRLLAALLVVGGPSLPRATAVASEPAADGSPTVAAAGAVARGAEELAVQLAAGAGPSAVALAVRAPAEPLRAAVETALAASLGRLGWSVVPLPRAKLLHAEAAAHAAGVDVLLSVHPVVAGGTLSLTAEAVPTRPNFFLQARPAFRPAGSRLVTATVEADAAARALAAATAMALSGLALRPLSELPEPVLALAAGATAAPGSAVRLVAVTPSAVLLIDAAGAVLSSHPLPPRPPGPRVRDPGATVAVADFGSGRVGYAVAGRGGEILSAAGDRLQRAGSMSAAPVAAGAAGTLYGAFAPGLGVLEDSFSLGGVPPPSPRSPRRLLGAAATPAPAPIAFGVLDDGFTLRLLGPTLATAAPDLSDVGAAFALADLDGDGQPELVVSSAHPGAEDRLAVVRPGAGGELLCRGGPVPGSLRAAAAADVTGDGIDDVVLSATVPGGGARLWLLTADPGRGDR